MNYSNTQISNFNIRTRAYFSFFILLGFISSVFFSYICSKYLSLPYPFDTPLFASSDSFRDMLTLLPISNLKNPYSFVPHSYGPFSVILLIPLANSNHYVVAGVFAFLCFLSMAFFYFNLVKEQTNWALDVLFFFTFSIVTYPFLFSLDRGNFELIVFIFSGIGIYGFVKNKSWLAIVFFVLAVNCKFYTVLLLILFLKKKEYKNFFITLGLSLLLTVASFWVLSIRNGVGVSELALQMYNNIFHFSSIAGAQTFSENYLFYNHTISAGFGLFNIWIGGLNFFEAWRVGGIISAVLFVLLLAYVLIFENEMWKLVLILSMMMIFFHGISYDYTLLNLIVPLYLIVQKFDQTQMRRPWYLFIFPVFFVPLKYHIDFHQTGISVFIYPLCAITILVGMVIEGLRGTDWKAFSGATTANFSKILNIPWKSNGRHFFIFELSKDRAYIANRTGSAEDRVRMQQNPD